MQMSRLAVAVNWRLDGRDERRQTNLRLNGFILAFRNEGKLYKAKIVSGQELSRMWGRYWKEWTKSYRKQV